MRILIAEDERITRASLARQLKKWGHTVEAAADGEEARELFGAGEFDVVITDWEMPRVSGLELVRSVRAASRSSYVYVIMLTSRSGKSDLISGIEAGADDYVSKPFDWDELRVRLLAGERILRLESTLLEQNERMRGDLEAAARVQRALLPSGGMREPEVRADFTYVPTDELAGDGLGFHVVDERHLVAYVVDVTGHGVPAALLAVTAMHALSPASGVGAAPARDGQGRPTGVRSPGRSVEALNRRFCSGDNDGRFLTMVLCVLDTSTGLLRFARAGHPLPVVVRGSELVPVGDAGGMPIGIMDDEVYEDVEVQLEPGDRVYLYSDGFVEQCEAHGVEQFGEDRFQTLLTAGSGDDGGVTVERSVRTLAEWAGTDQFADDLSLLAIEWRGGAGANGTG